MTQNQDFINGLGIIQGWQQIARHIGKSKRTARRWYDEYHMPLRYTITGRPFALTMELDKWMIYISDALKKDTKRMERHRKHAAYMRSCKKI